MPVSKEIVGSRGLGTGGNFGNQRGNRTRSRFSITNPIRRGERRVIVLVANKQPVALDRSRRYASRMTIARETGNYFEWTAANTLRPYELPKDQECRDGESDDEWVKRIGYEWEGNAGIPDLHQLRWFGRKEPGGNHAFVVILDDSSRWRAFFLSTFDSLLRFRAMMAPLISQTLLEVHLTQLDEKARKAFRAWHGHHPSRACNECNPEEAKRQREEEERFRQDSSSSTK